LLVLLCACAHSHPVEPMAAAPELARPTTRRPARLALRTLPVAASGERRVEISDTRQSFRLVLASDPIETTVATSSIEGTEWVRSSVDIPFRSVSVSVVLVDLGGQRIRDDEVDSVFQAFADDDELVVADEKAVAFAGAPAHRYDIYQGGGHTRAWMVVLGGTQILRVAVSSSMATAAFDSQVRLVEQLVVR